MQSLTNLQMKVPLQKLREIHGGFDWGLGNLLSLQKVEVVLRCGGAGMEGLEEEKLAVRGAIEAHPNHPTSMIAYE